MIEQAIQAVMAWIEAGMPRHANLDGQPARDASRALYAALTAARGDKEGVFWRGTNRKEERAEMARGVKITSRNHVSGLTENGLSVAKTPATVWAYGYKYAYQVAGDLTGEGSDGEPVIVNARPVSRLSRMEAVLKQDQGRQIMVTATIKILAERTGLSPEQVLWLAYN